MTLHAPDGERLVGFDNAHQVKGKRREALDHKHRLRTIKPCDYRDAVTLVADFWAACVRLAVAMLNRKRRARPQLSG